ncbi:MAG: hypothetical protein HYR72_27135 [Deltaproteobacteria bacterium]|nr:hypothetical protein [Deltaproteobacteria bacterium]MBI3390310.1 hypothetical protein [Deltaproteobacteria bacterium]
MSRPSVETITAFAGILTAVAALLTAGGLAYQLRQQERLTKFTMGVTALQQLAEEWGTRMVPQRQAAATALLAGKTDSSTSMVLDFFERVGLLVNNGALDEELAWHQFYEPLVHYWFANREFIRVAQARDQTIWQDLDKVAKRLMEIEARHRFGPSVPASPPSKSDVDAFLKDEIQSK